MKRKPIFWSVVSLNPFTFKEYISFNSANRPDSIFILKKEYVRTHVASGGGEYEIFNYTILDKNQIATSITHNNWSIDDIYEGRYGSSVHFENEIKVTNYSAWNHYVISDPKGEIRTIGYSKPEDAINALLKLSKNDHWDQ